MCNMCGTPNYILKIKCLIAEGQIPDVPPEEIKYLYVYHNDNCSHWKGLLCDCDPDIVIDDMDFEPQKEPTPYNEYDKNN